MADCDTFDGMDGCEDTDSTSGLHKTYHLYQSADLADYCYTWYNNSNEAMHKAKTFIEGAFDYTDHSCTVNIEYDRVDPKEPCRQCGSDEDCGFWDDHPCTNESIYWDGTAEYVKEWVNCKNLPIGDQAIVLTDCGSTAGGVGGDVAWTQTGRYLPDLPSSFELYGSSSAFHAMQTVLHEIGHNCMDGSCQDYDVSDHHYGRSDEYYVDMYTTKDYLTPMGRWTCVDPDQNACCQDHSLTTTEEKDNEYDCKMTWADCSLSTWTC